MANAMRTKRPHQPNWFSLSLPIKGWPSTDFRMLFILLVEQGLVKRLEIQICHGLNALTAVIVAAVISAAAARLIAADVTAATATTTAAATAAAASACRWRRANAGTGRRGAAAVATAGALAVRAAVTWGGGLVVDAHPTPLDGALSCKHSE